MLPYDAASQRLDRMIAEEREHAQPAGTRVHVEYPDRADLLTQLAVMGVLDLPRATNLCVRHAEISIEHNCPRSGPGRVDRDDSSGN